MERPPELLKAYAARLARVALFGRGADVVRLIRVAGLYGRAAKPGDSVGVRAAPDRVGIWQRTAEEGTTSFVRSMDMLHEWHAWANIGRIEPKGAKLRVVLIGESVARGTLYDPHFTPAQVLELILQTCLGPDMVEVVDLAKVSIYMEQLMELARSALLVEPDALVVFAGNNWAPYWNSGTWADNRLLLGAVLSEQGVAGLKRYAEDHVKAAIQRLVRSITELYQSRGIPVVWIVPEFNLGDWKDPENSAAWLPDGANRAWIAYRHASRTAFARGDLEAARDAALGMVDLDRGTNTSGLLILAECARRMGLRDEHRLQLQAARDAHIWDPIDYSPRSYSVVQETLRQEASRFECGLVDLPAVFRDLAVDGIPDRRFFLDYCHMTAEGIRVAMALAAESVAEALSTDISWRDLIDENIKPSSQAEAETSLLAAIHNAHWGQGYDIVRYHCMRALEQSPAISEIVRFYLDFQTRRTPMWMCKSAERVARLVLPSTQAYLLGNAQVLDRVLLDAMVASLKSLGIDAQNELNDLRRREIGVSGRRGIDLLDTYYYAALPTQREALWRLTPGRNDYYKAYDTRSDFVFIGTASRPIHLRITSRLPSPAPPDASVGIEVNGVRVVETSGSETWATWDVTVPGDCIRDGVNEVSIVWPLPQFMSDAALDQAVRDLDADRFPELYPVFGEIHCFHASDGTTHRDHIKH